jgi:hypothetical protein
VPTLATIRVGSIRTMVLFQSSSRTARCDQSPSPAATPSVPGTPSVDARLLPSEVTLRGTPGNDPTEANRAAALTARNKGIDPRYRVATGTPSSALGVSQSAGTRAFATKVCFLSVETLVGRVWRGPEV